MTQEQEMPEAPAWGPEDPPLPSKHGSHGFPDVTGSQCFVGCPRAHVPLSPWFSFTVAILKIPSYITNELTAAAYQPALLFHFPFRWVWIWVFYWLWIQRNEKKLGVASLARHDWVESIYRAVTGTWVAPFNTVVPVPLKVTGEREGDQPLGGLISEILLPELWF